MGKADGQKLEFNRLTFVELICIDDNLQGFVFAACFLHFFGGYILNQKKLCLVSHLLYSVSAWQI